MVEILILLILSVICGLSAYYILSTVIKVYKGDI